MHSFNNFSFNSYVAQFHRYKRLIIYLIPLKITTSYFHRHAMETNSIHKHLWSTQKIWQLYNKEINSVLLSTRFGHHTLDKTKPWVWRKTSSSISSKNTDTWFLLGLSHHWLISVSTQLEAHTVIFWLMHHVHVDTVIFQSTMYFFSVLALIFHKQLKEHTFEILAYSSSFNR